MTKLRIRINIWGFTKYNKVGIINWLGKIVYIFIHYF